MTLTAAQYRTVTCPSAWRPIPCRNCEDGNINRGKALPTRCDKCAGEGHVYVLKARVWSNV